MVPESNPSTASPENTHGSPGTEIIVLAYFAGLMLVFIKTKLLFDGGSREPFPVMVMGLWMLACALVAGSVISFRRHEGPPSRAREIMKSASAMTIVLILGLLASPVLPTILFLLAPEALLTSSRPAAFIYFARTVLPSSEWMLITMLFVLVSYLLLWMLPRFHHCTQPLRSVPLLLLFVGGGIIAIDIGSTTHSILTSRSAVAPASAVRPANAAEEQKWLETDCEAGNPKACEDLLYIVRHRAGPQARRETYVKVCRRGVPMASDPCVSLFTIDATSGTREQAIETVCGISFEGCLSVGKFLEDELNYGSAAYAYRLACTKKPGSEACPHAKELGSYAEADELVAPSSAPQDGPFCDYTPKQCFSMADTLVKEGRFSQAAWLYQTGCRHNKYPLDHCWPWLRFARLRTYFVAETQHLTELKALASPLEDHARLKPLVDQACKRGDGMSCFYAGVMKELRDPADVEGAKGIYAQACRLSFALGCTNALAVSTRHPGDVVPLPQDAEPHYAELCMDRNEVEACSELAKRMVNQFERKQIPERDKERERLRAFLEQACRKEIGAMFGYKLACSQLNRLKDIGAL